MGADPPPLGISPDPDALPPGTITREGLGGERVMALLRDALLPATTAIDHPRYLAFIPSVPTPASSLADLLVSAYAIYGGSWLESAGAVHAENEALRWLADLAGFPAGGRRHLRAGRDERQPVGAARRARARRATTARRPRASAVSEEVHSSVRSMLRVMDAGTLEVPGRGSPATRCARRSATRTASSRWSPPPAPPTSARSTTWPASPTCAASAGCGCTSTAPTASGRCARPACASASPASSTPTRSSSTRTSGCSRRSTRCALIYRDPAYGRAAHRQHAGYLESLYADDNALQPVRLRRPALAPPARAAVLVLARRPRHRRLHRGRRAHAGRHARGRRGDPAPRRPGARGRPGAVGPRLPPPRLGARRLRPLGGRPARVRHRVRAAHDPRRRGPRAARARQPADHARGHRNRSRRNDLNQGG